MADDQDAMRRERIKREQRIREKLKNDYPFFARNALVIRTKATGLQPFALNEPQLLVHSLAEAQRARTGKVRAILLKGRQQGMSTYVEGRLFHQTIHRFGCRTFILTHHADATANLFNMAKRYYENLPPLIKPNLGASSQRELSFPKLESGYRVGTAGTEGVGRSDTIQLFHGSEAAFWPNAEEHAAGVLQAIPAASDTEVWLESTANGVGGLFHKMWQGAIKGTNEYMPVFVQWWQTPEYRLPVPPGFELDDEEQEYMAAHSLGLDQMVWRRQKIQELQSAAKFQQEYPATPEEAFINVEGDVFVNPYDVLAARRAEMEVDDYAQLVIGVDPARFGDDRTAIIRRRGRVAYDIETYAKRDNMEVAGIVARIIDTEQPRMVFIDVGGTGSGVIDRLRELGYSRKILAVDFSKPASNAARYFNKRAEMWGECRDWLADAPVSIPDDDDLHADLCSPTYKYDSNQRYKLESKEDMRRRGVMSPDVGDALALTFAMPVAPKSRDRDRYKGKRVRPHGPMSA